jgi:DNA polymerase III epsilon subunit-like protein
MNLVSIDLETSGLDPETCQIWEFGAILNGPWDLDLCPRFHCYVTHDVYRGEPFAMQMHSKILQRIAARTDTYRYLRHDHLIREFLRWLRKYNHRDFNVCGKNFAGFDLPFLKKLKDWNEVPIHRGGRAAIDPGNLYWDPKVDGFALPDTLTCMGRAGIDGKVAHTALQDAEVVLDLVRRKCDETSKNYME